MRRFLVIALVLAAMLLSSCSGAQSTPTAEPVAEPTAAAEPTSTTATAAADPTATTATEPTATVAETGAGVELPEVNPLDVTGDIVTAGSSTVFPLSEKMAERFQDEGYAGNITIDSIGSGAGFERFCVDGDTDVANASRGIKDEEVTACQSIGREPVGIPRRHGRAGDRGERGE